MMRNLEAEIARRGIKKASICGYLGISEKSFRNKSQGKTDFTFPEACQIRDKFFADCTLEYLFTRDPGSAIKEK